MARVNVFLSDALLKAVDAEAAQSHTNRSALIQSVLEKFLEAVRQERHEAELQRKMKEAGRGMDALAHKLGAWDPVPIIRAFRDSRTKSRKRRP